MSKQPSFESAVRWAYIANWGEKGFSALFMFVLAAVLGPRDFGTVAIAVVYISFLQLFLDQGLALALIQTRDLEPEHANTVFWFDLALSGVFVSLGLLFRHRVANLNHAPEASMVIAALTPSILLEALAIVPMSLLRRRMDFKSISIRTNASMFAGGLVGTILALTGFRLWALVAQQLTRDLVAVVLIWRLSRWRPKLQFSTSHFRQLLPFSTANFIGQLSNFVDGQGSAVVLGAMFGPIAVGLYRLGERITNTVVTMSMASIQSVALPEFARLRDRPDDLRRTALHCIRLSGAVSVPALAALAALAQPLLATLGSRWIPAVNVLRILAVAGIVLVFSFFTGPLLQGVGRAREAALLDWVRVLPGLAALFAAGWLVRGSTPGNQVMGIALSKLIVAIVLTTPLALTVLLRLCRISLRELMACAFPSLAASACIVFSIFLVSAFTPTPAWHPATQFVVQGLAGAAAGFAAIMLFDAQLRGSIRHLSRRILTPFNAMVEKANP